MPSCSWFYLTCVLQFLQGPALSRLLIHESASPSYVRSHVFSFPIPRMVLPQPQRPVSASVSFSLPTGALTTAPSCWPVSNENAHPPDCSWWLPSPEWPCLNVLFIVASILTDIYLSCWGFFPQYLSVPGNYTFFFFLNHQLDPKLQSQPYLQNLEKYLAPNRW